MAGLKHVSQLSLAAALALSAPAFAQSTIVPDQVGPNDIATAVVSLDGTISITGGTSTGHNLFHSFTRFDLAGGDIAQWVRGEPDAASIRNVINRVTGGDPSDIGGTLRITDMPNADLWLINPAGIVFGQGAVVDVPNAAHFTTAGALRFQDGASFSALTPTGSTFTSAPPVAFGFLGDQGSIVATALSQDFVRSGSAISLSASDLAIAGSFAAGEIALLAVGQAAADIAFGEPAPTVGDGRITIGRDGGTDVMTVASARIAASTVTLGGISLTAVNDVGPGGGIAIDTDALTLDGAFVGSLSRDDGTGGPISIRADVITARAGNIQSASLGNGSAGSIALTAKQIELSEMFLGSTANGAGGAGAVLIDAGRLNAVQSTIFSTTYAAGNAEAVKIRADDFALARSIVASQTEFQATGNAAGVQIEGTSLRFEASQISSSTFGAGDAGSVSVIGATADLVTSAVASTSNLAATGNGGKVAVDVGDLRLDATSLTTSTFGTGNAGILQVDADSIIMDKLASLTSDANFGSQGNAGNVVVAAGSLSARNSFISSSTFGPGRAGGVRLAIARALDLGGTVVAANTFGSGDGGNISIDAESISVHSFATIDTGVRMTASGGGGDIAIRTGNLLVDSGGYISSSTRSGRSAGNIDIDAGSVRIGLAGEIRSQAEEGSSGNSGDVTLRAEHFDLAGGLVQSGTFGSGDAGTVRVRAGTVILAPQARLLSRSEAGATGNAGTIDIAADRIVANGGRISSSTRSSGNAGNVTLAAGEIELSGATLVETSSDEGGTGDAGTLTVAGNRLTMTEAGLSSIGANGGDAGDIVILVDEITANDAVIAAATFASGDGGAVRIVADKVMLANDTRISSLTGGTGTAGHVDIAAGTISLNDSSIDSLTGGAGAAGDVTITADRVALAGGSINSQTQGSGRGGNVIVKAAELLLDASDVSASAEAEGAAGAVSLIASRIELRNDSSVDSQAEITASGYAGSVSIVTDTLFADASQISSGTFGTGNAGTVTIMAGDPRDSGSGEIILSSDAYISSFTGSSGAGGSIDITAGSITLFEGASIDSEALSMSSGAPGNVSISVGTLISQGGLISSATRGAGMGGSIAIEAWILDIFDGGSITTDAAFGPAGDIALLFPRGGRLSLIGASPSVITTTSGMNAGGRITIAAPYLILSNGGRILALGQRSGANVRIASDFYIRSADRLNLLSVNGSLVLDSQISDLSAGAETPSLNFFDASSVLSGQCTGTQSSGRTSRFMSRASGPYAPQAHEWQMSPGSPIGTPIASLGSGSRCPHMTRLHDPIRIRTGGASR